MECTDVSGKEEEPEFAVMFEYKIKDVTIRVKYQVLELKNG